MKKLILALALLAAALSVVPGAASAKSKKKPKPAVYTIYGGYDLTHVNYSQCMPGSGGVISETYRTKRHYSYSGDTKRGFTIKEFEEAVLIRESTNEYVPSRTLASMPRETVKKVAGSDVLGVTKTRGTFSFAGIGVENQRQSFRVPKKVGEVSRIKVSTTQRIPGDPGVGCTVEYEDNTVEGAILIKRIQ